MMFQKFITVFIVTAAIAFRLLQLAADILGGFLSAHDHRHLVETRGWLREYGKPIAALWRAEADQEQYEYACEYASRSGYRVHTFPTTMSLADAKAAAVKEHAAAMPGRSRNRTHITEL